MQIAVVTAGGDSPGMNACIRAIVRASKVHGFTVLGVNEGVVGWARGAVGDLRVLADLDVSSLLDRRGTILGTAREGHIREFLKTAGVRTDLHLLNDETLLDDEVVKETIGQMAARTIRSNSIAGVIVIGGDKSSRVTQLVFNQMSASAPMIVVPASIDNDVLGTELTIGFDSAVARAVDYVDDLRETARALSRIFVVEVMGREQGHIAVEVALATGAEEVVVPEVVFDEYAADQMIQRLEASRQGGRGSAIVIVAEGARLEFMSSSPPGVRLSAGQRVGMKLSEALSGVGWEVRTHVVGHVQRGAAPSVATRNLAAECGVFGVDYLASVLASREPPEHPKMCCISRSGELDLRDVTGDMVSRDTSVILARLALCKRLSYHGQFR